MLMICYWNLIRGLKKMKILSIIPLLICSSVFAQTPIQTSGIGSDLNTLLPKFSTDKMNLFQTNNLNNLDLTLQSKKIKGVSAQHKSLSSSSNLALAQEYENRFNVGVNFTKGGVLSLNAINQKTYGNIKEDNFFGMSFTKNTSSVNIIFQIHQLNSSKIKIPGQDATVANLKATINL